MNKKGVTLIELMAVIAIIGMLAIMITPGVISLRNSVLESAYENKVSQIINENDKQNLLRQYPDDLNRSGM